MASICILFPAFCHGLREPDPEFLREQQALETLGIPWRVVNVDALCAGDLEKAFKYFGDIPTQPLIYRGWILHPEEYAILTAELSKRNCALVTSAVAYRSALLLPNYFPAISDHSFPATWIAGDDPKQALEAAERLGPPPYFIKDYAKSAKEIWPDGCVVRSKRSMASTIRKLKEFRGDRFEGGIVIRPLLRLRYLGESPFGGRIYEEYRLFFFQGCLLSESPYDRLGENYAPIPDYRFLSQRVQSPFFSADIVVTEDGGYYVLEVGDGGSSALPPNVSATDFYSSISRVVAANGMNIPEV